MNKILSRHVLPSILLPLLLCCNTPQQETEYHLGQIDFNPGSIPEAQAAFKKGMLLLHSFEYADAAEAFREAITLDPDFAMAYWGEAMTCNHPIWQEQDYDKGNEILNELAPTPAERLAKSPTPLEKDLLQGVEILFGPGNKAERDSSYAGYMAGLYQKYPDNDEVACLYSISLIGWAVTGSQISLSDEAANVALKVLERNPQHPGALHYTIHAWDHPEYADKALAVANKYAGIAPDAGHALHMPTHTYLALGMWNEVVSSNEVSWAAEMARRDRKKLTNDALGYHSYHWLQYGLLQKGQQERARLMIDSMYQYCKAQPSPKARAHMALLTTTYAAEVPGFDDGLLALDFESGDLNIGIRAARYYTQGYDAWRKKDPVALENIIRKMAGERLTDADRVLDGGLRLCGNINRSIPTPLNIKEAEAMEAQLQALQALLKQDATAAERWLVTAVKLQDETGYAYGPPNMVKPPAEMYAEWLLENNRPQEALEQFNKALQKAPNRLLSLRGKEKAEQALKNESMASK